MIQIGATEQAYPTDSGFRVVTKRIRGHSLEGRGWGERESVCVSEKERENERERESESERASEREREREREGDRTPPRGSLFEFLPPVHTHSHTLEPQSLSDFPWVQGYLTCMKTHLPRTLP